MKYVLVALMLAGVTTPALAERDTRTLPSNVQVQPAASDISIELLRLLDDSQAVPASGIDARGLRAFYQQRNFAPLWVGPVGPTRLGAAALAALRARAAGLGVTDQLLEPIAVRLGSASRTDRAALELLVSAAVVDAAVEAANPPIAIGTKDVPGAYGQRALAAAGGARDADSFLSAWLPANAGYWRLRRAFGQYLTLAVNGGWNTVPEGPKLELDMREPRVRALRERLVATGDLATAGLDQEVFDSEVLKAVQSFQARHGLEPDGVVGKGTVAALNVPVEDRLAVLALNMDRLRRTPTDSYERLVYVNIPAAELRVFEQGRVAMRAVAIVGRPDRPTPELESEITRIELNPFWNVPPRIAKMDLLPRVQKDGGYFREHNIRVYSDWSENSRELDPSTINWFTSDAAQMRYRLRQDPGPDSSLGPAKFVFANSHSVYIHGTNKQSLFDRSGRALSSGCIRVDDPIGLAALLLQGTKWTRELIEQTVGTGKPQIAKLAAPVAVKLDYITAWADESDAVHFRGDLYRLDRPVKITPQIAAN